MLTAPRLAPPAKAVLAVDMLPVATLAATKLTVGCHSGGGGGTTYSGSGGVAGSSDAALSTGHSGSDSGAAYSGSATIAGDGELAHPGDGKQASPDDGEQASPGDGELASPGGAEQASPGIAGLAALGIAGSAALGVAFPPPTMEGVGQVICAQPRQWQSTILHLLGREDFILGLQSEKKQMADGTRFGGRVCPSLS
ncbi:UNVERIFIED_CONTAM: hypothetical protein FKN15_039792 [Acipenser sinensis]